jgi:hypothetical protein
MFPLSIAKINVVQQLELERLIYNKIDRKQVA